MSLASQREKMLEPLYINNRDQESSVFFLASGEEFHRALKLFGKQLILRTIRNLARFLPSLVNELQYLAYSHEAEF